MADLQLNQRWEAWAPTLDGNDQLERPFFFELSCGLTRAEMRRLVEPLQFRRRHPNRDRDYLMAVSEVADQAALLEPLHALQAANSLGGQQVLFSKRHSGGGSTTGNRSAAKKAGQKEGR